MLKIYHNPRCRKSREGLEYLKGKTTDFEIVDYLKVGLSEDEIREFLLKTSLKPIDLVRKQEEIFKKELKGKEFTDEEWIKIISENPKLLQRPIILGKQKAVWAQPADKADSLF